MAGTAWMDDFSGIAALAGTAAKGLLVAILLASSGLAITWLVRAPHLLIAERAPVAEAISPQCSGPCDLTEIDLRVAGKKPRGLLELSLTASPGAGGEVLASAFQRIGGELEAEILSGTPERIEVALLEPPTAEIYRARFWTTGEVAFSVDAPGTRTSRVESVETRALNLWILGDVLVRAPWYGILTTLLAGLYLIGAIWLVVRYGPKLSRA